MFDSLNMKKCQRQKKKSRSPVKLARHLLNAAKTDGILSPGAGFMFKTFPEIVMTAITIQMGERERSAI